MIFSDTPIDGAYLVDLDPRTDERGSFARAFCQREFAAKGIVLDIAQCNLAHTLHAGVVRGLHFQEHPAEEQKLVRCVAGAVFDALVDMRTDSRTYRAVFWTRLDAKERRSLFIPAGVAHGYQALESNTEFLYMTDQFYAPGFEKGVRYSDPSVAVPWPLPARDVTERDEEWPLLD